MCTTLFDMLNSLGERLEVRPAVTTYITYEKKKMMCDICMKSFLHTSQPSHFNGGNQSYNLERLGFPVHCGWLQSDNLGEFYMLANCTTSRGY
jgi:hypothetical protein